MRIPRDLSGEDLAKALKKFGYRVSRQTGSHMRLTTQEQGEHHVTIPMHPALRIGTLAGIVQDVANHLKLERDEFLRRLFGK